MTQGIFYKVLFDKYQNRKPDTATNIASRHVIDLVYPQFEAGFEMLRQVLLYLRIPVPEIQSYTETLRHQMLEKSGNSEDDYATLGHMRAAEQQFDLQWVELSAGNPLIEKSIAEAEIRKVTGVLVVGVLRDGELETNPEPSFRLKQNDLVAIHY